MNDLSGDVISHLMVLENSGPTYFVNDSTGNMVYDKVVLKPKSKAIETYDVNQGGVMEGAPCRSPRSTFKRNRKVRIASR